MYKAGRLCREFVFTDKSVISLMKEIASYFETKLDDDTTNIENFLEDLTITYDPMKREYIASVYIQALTEC